MSIQTKKIGPKTKVDIQSVYNGYKAIHLVDRLIDFLISDSISKCQSNLGPVHQVLDAMRHAVYNNRDVRHSVNL
mgnify:CR=1